MIDQEAHLNQVLAMTEAAMQPRKATASYCTECGHGDWPGEKICSVCLARNGGGLFPSSRTMVDC